MATDSVLIAMVLARYPDVLPGSLTFPVEAVDWTEKEVDLFVGSGGFLKPKKKKRQVSTISTATLTSPPPPPKAAPLTGECTEPAYSAGRANGVSGGYHSVSLLPSIDALSLVGVAPLPASGGLSTQSNAPSSVTHPPVAATIAELPLMVWHEGQFWAPYTTYMEDVDERGLKIVAAMNKSERFRSLCLKKV